MNPPGPPDLEMGFANAGIPPASLGHWRVQEPDGIDLIARGEIRGQDECWPRPLVMALTIADGPRNPNPWPSRVARIDSTGLRRMNTRRRSSIGPTPTLNSGRIGVCANDLPGRETRPGDGGDRTASGGTLSTLMP